MEECSSLMNLFRRILSNLPALLTPHRSLTPDRHLQVTNLTNKLLLASYVTLADQGATRRKGLLGRKQLSSDEGLWILPCEAVHTFGMQFPIDLIYLDRSHRIIKISSAVPPWRLSICLSGHSVLELASGAIRDSQTKRGDKLLFQVCGSGLDRQDNQGST